MYRELSLEQARQSIDTDQAFAAYMAVSRDLSDRFKGSMSWRSISGADYLYRTRSGLQKSIGRRSPETERAYSAFVDGRTKARASVQSLAARLDWLAPVNRAMGLARVPAVAAKIIRELHKAGLMGRSIFVVGTNALFAYERLCAVQIASGVLATADVDLLLDSRSNLKLVSTEIAEKGIVGIVRKIDSTFRLMHEGGFRAVNDNGFMIDLIRPTSRDPLRTFGRSRVSSAPDDLTAVEIEGLAWLVNAPKLNQTVVDERGYPVEMVCPDPRVFALHKLWLSRRSDREAAKARRDEAQARLVAELVQMRAPALPFSDASALMALPVALRNLASEFSPNITQPSTTPNW